MSRSELVYEGRPVTRAELARLAGITVYRVGRQLAAGLGPADIVAGLGGPGPGAGRKPRLYEYRGAQMTIRQLAELAPVSVSTLRGRLADGWPVERAVTEPPTPRGERVPRPRAVVVDVGTWVSPDVPVATACAPNVRAARAQLMITTATQAALRVHLLDANGAKLLTAAECFDLRVLTGELGSAALINRLRPLQGGQARFRPDAGALRRTVRGLIHVKAFCSAVDDLRARLRATR